MLLAGIIGNEGIPEIASLINSIFTTSGIRVEIRPSTAFTDFRSDALMLYLDELKNLRTGILVLTIDPCDIDNRIFDRISFDIVIYSGKNNYFSEAGSSVCDENRRRILNLLDSKGVAIVNDDDGELVCFLEGMRRNCVTYGFNSKASITASSTGDDILDRSFLCCQQRTVTSRDGKVIEPQEYRILTDPGDNDAHNILAAAAFAIINGIDLNYTENIQH